jgi:hypothetical protein
MDPEILLLYIYILREFQRKGANRGTFLEVSSAQIEGR